MCNPCSYVGMPRILIPIPCCFSLCLINLNYFQKLISEFIAKIYYVLQGHQMRLLYKNKQNLIIDKTCIMNLN